MRTQCIAALFAASVAALDCSAKELDQYDFASIKGVYSDSVTRSTPPSKSTFSWNIGICQTLDDLKDCPQNSDICGTTRIQVDDKDILSEVIGINSNLQKSYIPFSNEGKNRESGINITYHGVNWGDALVSGTLKFVCVKGGDTNENKLSLSKWDGSVFELVMHSPAACVNGKGGHKGPSPPKPGDDGESWGWFTWIFIFIVLFLSIYIIGGAWFQYNKGNSIDFQSALKEVLENFVDLLKGLPTFVKEIVEKVTGHSNRGEYSAV